MGNFARKILYNDVYRGGVSPEIRRQYGERICSPGGISCYAHVHNSGETFGCTVAHLVWLQPKGSAK
jgi:hypothetical protein